MPAFFPILFAALIAIIGILVPYFAMYRTIRWASEPRRILFDKVSAVAIVIVMLLLMGFSWYAAARTYVLLRSIGNISA